MFSGVLWEGYNKSSEGIPLLGTPFSLKILLAILLTVSRTNLMVLAKRIWYLINL